MTDYFEPDIQPEIEPEMLWCTQCEQNVMVKPTDYYDWNAVARCPNCGCEDLDEFMEDM